MTSRPLIALLLLTLTACEPEDDTRVPDAPPAPAATDEVDDGVPAAHAEEASEVVHAFHRALASGDSAAALGMLHPEAVIYEAGHAETLDEYRAGHLAADIRFATATERHVLDERTLAMEGTVLYLAETHTSGRLNDREIDARGVETVLLVRAPEGWRIRHVHWSSRS